MSHLTQKILLGLIAVGALFLWLRSHDAAVRAQALAKQSEDSLARVTASRDSLDKLKVVADGAARDSIAKLLQRTALSKVQVRTLSRRADSLVARLNLTIGDSLIRDALAVKDSNIAVLALSVSDIQNALGLSNARWWVADSAASAWRSIATNAQSQLRAAIKRSAPRFACVGGVGLSAGLGGSAGGLTVACGYRF